MAAPQLLERFPTEILCHVLAQLDLESALSASRSSLRLARVLKENWAAILLPILERDFRPVESLLRLPEALPDGMDRHCGAWSKRRIYFNGRKVSGGDRRGRLLPPLTYGREHMRRVLWVCKIVKSWEDAFPRLRFAPQAESARSLYTHENRRFRRALYEWWRFASLFHQDSYQPVAWLRDGRGPGYHSDYLRTLSTTLLYELQDLWETVRWAVATDLCPSVSVVLQNGDQLLSRTDAARLGWGHRTENELIVATVMRLLPSQMLHFLDSRHVYATKNSLVTAMRLVHPSIENGVEYLGEALTLVLQERRDRIRMESEQLPLRCLVYFPTSGFPRPHGGILDFHVGWWGRLRAKLANDGDTNLEHSHDAPPATAYLAPHQLRLGGLLEPSH